MNSHSHDANIRTVGKLAILQAVIDAERVSDLYVASQYPIKFHNHDAVKKSWLPDFAFMLADGHGAETTLDTIFDKLRIINFNYDRCLEHFLLYQLRQMFPYKEEQYFANLIKTKLKAIRPYGRISPLPWQSADDAVAFGGNSSGQDIVPLARRILTYSEQIEEPVILANIDGVIDWAEVIVFLGFHFHEQNMDLLVGKRDHASRRNTNVSVFSTHVGRSEAEIRIISNQIKRMLHGRSIADNSSYGKECDCKSLFKDFGTTLTSA